MEELSIPLADRIARMTRRAFVAVGAAFPLVAQPAFARRKRHAPGDARLWYRQPASHWEEALPVGNGRLGAMVFGRPVQERLQLNEDTLWAGSPYVPDNPDAFAALPEVRRLIADGKFKEAANLAGAKMMAKPLRQMSYGTLGDLLIDFANAGRPITYERSLDLENAIALTRYRTGGGWVSREVFASPVDQLIVMRLEGPTGTIDLDVKYRGPRQTRHAAPDYTGAATEPAAISAVDWGMREEEDSQSRDVQVRPDGADAVLITGRNEDGENVAGRLSYAIRMQLLSDGKVEASGTGLRLRGGTHATMLIAAGTSYVNSQDVGGDPVAAVRRQTEAGARKNYAAIKRDHVQAHRALFNTMSIDLGRTSAAELPTDERIRAAETGGDPALAALYLQYARCLLISSSRPGTQPANLQGIWNDGTNPPWGSKYTININTEMNYWPADPANLGICVEPLLRMVEELSVTGARTAKTMYRARGWVTHHNTDLWRAAAPIDGPEWGLWPLGGAWLCTTLWDHWDYSRDEIFLRRLYPLMKGASLFFLDTLVEDPDGRGLVTSPSISPENQHPFGSAVCAGPAMDRQILRDLFDRTIDAGKRLAQDAQVLQQLSAARRRLAPDRIGKLGQLQEWLEDWDAEAPEQQHRHVSHLYAVYPSSQLNVRDHPDFIRAAEVTLNTRGDKSTGWATAWRLCLWARMANAERAYSILLGLLGPQRTYPNMFDSHPPFQIDGNFGGAAGIIEMLVQSWGGELILLPALPKAWPEGSILGVRARGGLIVDLHWRDGQLRRLLIKGPPGQSVRIRHAGKMRDVRLSGTGIYSL
ncbi:MAG: glycoside hydrolase family 95 protein [Pseudomonadota bacterium]|nr:glycoside hydrolase family 95 protein [Pseudomonadota bacterium]